MKCCLHIGLVTCYIIEMSQKYFFHISMCLFCEQLLAVSFAPDLNRGILDIGVRRGLSGVLFNMALNHIHKTTHRPSMRSSDPKNVPLNIRCFIRVGHNPILGE